MFGFGCFHLNFVAVAEFVVAAVVAFAVAAVVAFAVAAVVAFAVVVQFVLNFLENLY